MANKLLNWITLEERHSHTDDDFQSNKYGFQSKCSYASVAEWRRRSKRAFHTPRPLSIHDEAFPRLIKPLSLSALGTL